MKATREPKLRPRMQQAVEELKGLVRERYPEAGFRVARSPEDPRIIHLWAIVDEDGDVVIDVVIDRMMEIQIEDELPIFVIPVRPGERALEMRPEARATAEQATDVTAVEAPPALL